jgi:hypothetical protein
MAWLVGSATSGLVRSGQVCLEGLKVDGGNEVVVQSSGLLILGLRWTVGLRV